MKTVSLFGCLLALLASPLPVMAQASGTYVGIGIGASKGDLHSDRLDAAFAAGGTPVSSRSDENDIAYRAVLGYRYNAWFALETAYVDFGQYEYAASSASGSTKGHTKAWAAGINALGFYPLMPQLEAFGRVGIHYTEVKTDAIRIGGVTARSAESETGFSPSIGAGVSSDVFRHLTIRFEFDRYFNVGNANTTGESDINVGTVSALIRF